MLAAHLVPGYLAAAESRSGWQPEWNATRRALLWIAALGSTIAPDLDVVYNATFRGFFNHSVLWTHSVFIYLGLGLLWFLLRTSKRWSYLRTLIGLVALGGFSHLLLDVIAHGTPLLYPVSMMVFSIAPKRVIEGGILAYLTDPIFLLEPLLFDVAVVHWTYQRQISQKRRRVVLSATIGGLILFAVIFSLVLFRMQEAVIPLLSNP